MQYSIIKLLLLVTGAALFFTVMRSIHFLGPMCLPVGLVLILFAGVAYPIAILNSPQKDTHLDPASNPVLPYIHLLAGVGAGFILLFFIYFASDPFRYLYR